MKKAWIWAIAIIAILVVSIAWIFIDSSRFPNKKHSVMSDDQIRAKVYELYGGDSKRVVVYPDSKMISIEIGKNGTFAIGIKNLENSSLKFSYNISIEGNQSEKYCNISNQELLNIINNGNYLENISISSGDLYVSKVNLSFKYGNPFCLVRYLIKVYANGELYGSETMDVNFKP